jgi:hypothetical protein
VLELLEEVVEVVGILAVTALKYSAWLSSFDSP